MSDIVDIRALRKQFDEKVKEKDLQEFATSQQKLIEKLLLENKKLQDKTEHLEQVLASLTKLEGSVQRITPEEIICIEQINLLHKRSTGRELSLEEVKRLDLLIKNLRLIREQSTQVIEATSYREVKEEDLVRLATTPDTGNQ